jgi:hypothetical protein
VVFVSALYLVIEDQQVLFNTDDLASLEGAGAFALAV